MTRYTQEQLAAWLAEHGTIRGGLQNITLPQGSGIPAVGSLIKILTLNSPGTYVPIGNLGNIKWGLKIKDADTTNQGTIWTQGIPTISEGGTITGDMFFIPGSAGADYDANTLEGHSFVSGLGYIATTQQVRQYSLTWPDGHGMFFQAYITDYPVDMAVEKALTTNITFKVSGQPTFF